jgi:hypothetical protein
MSVIVSADSVENHCNPLESDFVPFLYLHFGKHV